MTKEYADMLACVKDEIKYPESKSYGPDWQQVEWVFHPGEQVEDVVGTSIDLEESVETFCKQFDMPDDDLANEYIAYSDYR